MPLGECIMQHLLALLREPLLCLDYGGLWDMVILYECEQTIRSNWYNPTMYIREAQNGIPQLSINMHKEKVRW